MAHPSPSCRCTEPPVTLHIFYLLAVLHTFRTVWSLPHLLEGALRPPLSEALSVLPLRREVRGLSLSWQTVHIFITVLVSVAQHGRDLILSANRVCWRAVSLRGTPRLATWYFRNIFTINEGMTPELGWQDYFLPPTSYEVQICFPFYSFNM